MARTVRSKVMEIERARAAAMLPDPAVVLTAALRVAKVDTSSETIGPELADALNGLRHALTAQLLPDHVGDPAEEQRRRITWESVERQRPTPKTQRLPTTG